MKNSNCNDDKMAAYCEAVRRLEDKFEGLEHNHIVRKYNEEAEELAKIVSGRTTVPPNVFARDVSKPSIETKVPGEPSKPSPSNMEGDDPMMRTCRTGPKHWVSRHAPETRPR